MVLKPSIYQTEVCVYLSILICDVENNVIVFWELYSEIRVHMNSAVVVIDVTD
jgi:hypothetical protein